MRGKKGGPKKCGIRYSGKSVGRRHAVKRSDPQCYWWFLLAYIRPYRVHCLHLFGSYFQFVFTWICVRSMNLEFLSGKMFARP